VKNVDWSSVLIGALVLCADSSEPPKVGPEGVLAFCSDLQVEPTDLIVLILAFKFNAKHMGEFSRAEFVEGMKATGVDSIEALKAKIPTLLQEFKNPALFKSLYAWSFDFAREEKKNAGAFALSPALYQTDHHADLAMAQNFWELLLADKFPLLNVWNKFLETKSTLKVVTRDMYLMLYEFARNIKSDMSNYDDSGVFVFLAVCLFLLMLLFVAMMQRRIRLCLTSSWTMCANLLLRRRNNRTDKRLCGCGTMKPKNKKGQKKDHFYNHHVRLTHASP
jgi:hypothetical protein